MPNSLLESQVLLSESGFQIHGELPMQGESLFCVLSS